MSPSADSEKKPSPNVPTPPLNADDTVAPNKEQTNLVLRNLEQALKDQQKASQLEKETGMSREQMEQFVQKFKKAPKREAAPGREIKVKPTEARKLNPNRTLPDLNPSVRPSTTQIRNRGSFSQDNVRDNVEGTRFVVPMEIKTGFDAYRSSLSRSKTLNPSKTAPGSGGN